jgi:hypothetical protein
MKRIYLQRITQYGSVSYIGKIDPRELIKVVKKVEMRRSDSFENVKFRRL